MEKKVQTNIHLSFCRFGLFVFLVHVTKFAFEDFIFVVGTAENSVGITLEFAVLRSGPDPKYSASCFSLSTTMVFAAVRIHFPRKTPACLVDRTAINEQLFKGS